MNTENNVSSNMIMPEPAHQEHHHRRALIVVAIILGLLVIGGVVYQLISSRGDRAEQETALRDQYELEQLAMAQKFFEQHPPSTEPMTEAEIKAREDFFKKYASDEEMTEEDAKQMQENLESLQKLENEKYEAWKSGQSAQ